MAILLVQVKGRGRRAFVFVVFEFKESKYSFGLLEFEMTASFQVELSGRQVFSGMLEEEHWIWER